MKLKIIRHFFFLFTLFVLLLLNPQSAQAYFGGGTVSGYCTGSHTSAIALGWGSLSGSTTLVKIERNPGGSNWPVTLTPSMENGGYFGYSDTNVEVGRPYVYKVTATSAAGEEVLVWDSNNSGTEQDWSAVRNPPACGATLTAPTVTGCTPGNPVMGTNISSGSDYTVSWTNGNTAASYIRVSQPAHGDGNLDSWGAWKKNVSNSVANSPASVTLFSGTTQNNGTPGGTFTTGSVVNVAYFNEFGAYSGAASFTPAACPNVPPTCDFTGPPSPLVQNDAARFTSTSTDSDGTIESYVWSTDEITPTYAYADTFDWTPTTIDTNTVTLTVTDNQGASSACNSTLTIGAPTPTPLFPYTLNGSVFKDANNNGVKDTGESVVEGAILCTYVNGERTCRTTAKIAPSAADGTYSLGFVGGTYDFGLGSIPYGYKPGKTNPRNITLPNNTQDFTAGANPLATLPIISDIFNLFSKQSVEAQSTITSYALNFPIVACPSAPTPTITNTPTPTTGPSTPTPTPLSPPVVKSLNVDNAVVPLLSRGRSGTSGSNTVQKGSSWRNPLKVNVKAQAGTNRTIKTTYSAFYDQNSSDAVITEHLISNDRKSTFVADMQQRLKGHPEYGFLVAQGDPENTAANAPFVWDPNVSNGNGNGAWRNLTTAGEAGYQVYGLLPNGQQDINKLLYTTFAVQGSTPANSTWTVSFNDNFGQKKLYTAAYTADDLGNKAIGENVAAQEPVEASAPQGAVFSSQIGAYGGTFYNGSTIYGSYSYGSGGGGQGNELLDLLNLNYYLTIGNDVVYFIPVSQTCQ